MHEYSEVDCLVHLQLNMHLLCLCIANLLRIPCNLHIQPQSKDSYCSSHCMLPVCIEFEYAFKHGSYVKNLASFFCFPYKPLHKISCNSYCILTTVIKVSKCIMSWSGSPMSLFLIWNTCAVSPTRSCIARSEWDK